MSFGLDWVTKPYKKQIAKLGGELAETKVILQEYKDKLEQIKQLLRNAPIPPEEIPDEIMKILLVSKVSSDET